MINDQQKVTLGGGRFGRAWWPVGIFIRITKSTLWSATGITPKTSVRIMLIRVPASVVIRTTAFTRGSDREYEQIFKL